MYLRLFVSCLFVFHGFPLLVQVNKSTTVFFYLLFNLFHRSVIHCYVIKLLAMSLNELHVNKGNEIAWVKVW
jgi:hypothetical protein